jgi:O-antigen ligase
MAILILPFSKAIPNIIVALLTVLFFINFQFEKPKKLFLNPIVLLFVFTLYLTIKAIIFQTFIADIKIYQGYLLMIWLLVLLTKINNINHLKMSALISIIFMVLVSAFLIGKYFLQYHELPFTNNEEVNELLVLERPYAGFMAVMGFFLSLQMIKAIPKYKVLFILSGASMIIFILIISARLSILTLFILSIVYLLFFFKTQLVKKIGALLFLFLTFTGIIFFNKNISERFFIKDNFEQSVLVASDYEPRLVIWKCGEAMMHNDTFNYFFGFNSYTEITQNYQECYGKSIDNLSKRDYFITSRFNSHNQFLDFFLIGGLIAIIFLFVFFFKLFQYVKNDFLETALLLSVIFFFIVENILYRQYGCYAFSIFAAMLIKKNAVVNEKN